MRALVVEILRYVVGAAGLALLIYLHIKAYHSPKDLGDGGIRTLFDDHKKSN